MRETEPEPPGQIDKRACKVLRNAFESEDARLELDESLRDDLNRFHQQLYLGLSNYTGPLTTEEVIAGVMSRYSLWVPKAVAKSLELYISRADINSTNRTWRSITDRLDADLGEIYLGSLQKVTYDIFNEYHKLTKPQPIEIIQKFDVDKVIDYYGKLGKQFDKLFNAPGLFPNLEEYTETDIQKETQLFSDEDLTIIERIKRFELYRDTLNGDILDLESNTIFDIAEAYWIRSEEESDQKLSMDLIEVVIDRAIDQKIGTDVALGYEKLGGKLSAIGKFSEAEKRFNEALKFQRKFGNDNTVAIILNKLAQCIIEDQDSNLSKADDLLSEAENIWLKLGYKKSMLFTLSIQVRLLVAEKKYQDALAKIDKGMGLFDEKFYPRGRWMFLSECAEYLLNAPDVDINSRGYELLDQAIDIAKHYGEFSSVIRSLSIKQKYAKDEFTRNEAQAEYELHINLKKELDEYVEDFYNKQGEDNELSNFVIKLKIHNYRQGLRVASNFIPIDRVVGMDAEYYDSFEGDYGRYKSLQQELERLLPARRNLKWSKEKSDKAHELLENFENLTKEFDSLYSETLAMEFRFFANFNYRMNLPYFSKKKNHLMKKEKSLIINLIQNWQTIDSKSGVMRWKRRLAEHLVHNSNNTKINPKVISIMQEIADFYRGRDARKYVYARFDLITWRLGDQRVNSAREYDELLKDPDFPEDREILIEALRRTASNLRKEDKSDEAITMMRKANNLAMEKLTLTKPNKVDIQSFGKEIDWCIAKPDIDLARERIDTFNKTFGSEWGTITAILTKFWNGQIRHIDGDIENSKIEFRKGIHKFESINYTRALFWRLNLPFRVSRAFQKLIEIHTELGQLDKANEVTIEKLYFDSKYGFIGASSHTLDAHVDAIIDISSTKSAKEFLNQIIDDANISPTIVSWAICKLHIKLEEWGDAEVVLKNHLYRLCYAEAYGRLNSTIDKLVSCCQKNKGRKHVISTLEELVDNDIHEIVSSSLHTLVRIYKEEEDFEKMKLKLEYKIDLELENNQYHVATWDYISLADAYVELEEHEKAKNILINHYFSITSYRLAQQIIEKLVQIYRENSEINQAKETLQEIIRKTEESEHQFTALLWDALINLHIESGDLLANKDILRKYISLENTSHKAKQVNLDKLFKLHYNRNEHGYAKEVLQEKLTALERFQQPHDVVELSTGIINFALEITDCSVAEKAMMIRCVRKYPNSGRRAKKILPAIEEYKSLSQDDLEIKIQESFLEASNKQKEREMLNEETRSFVQERDQINGKVKDLTSSSKELKSERNEFNKKSSVLKKIKQDKSKILKQVRRNNSSTQTDIQNAEKEQEKAHNNHMKVVRKAQVCHDRINELGDIIDKNRQKANAAHIKFQNVRKQANSSHEGYIENMLYFEAAVRAKMENNLTN